MKTLTKEEIKELIKAHERGEIVADLSNQNLTCIDLNGVNLAGVNLSGADLSWGDFIGANLSGANLSRANLSRANISGADLTGADLTEAIIKDAKLIFANLRNAVLKTANFTWANLTRAQIKNADLSNAKLVLTDLCGANLLGANLSGALIDSVNINAETILKDVNTENAKIIGDLLTEIKAWDKISNKEINKKEKKEQQILKEFDRSFFKKMDYMEKDRPKVHAIVLEDFYYLKEADQGATSFNMSLPYFRRRMVSVKYMQFLEKHKRGLKEMPII